MDEIGEILRGVGGKWIIKLRKIPDKTPIAVFDSEKKEIGKLLDIIGPVKSPYGVAMLKICSVGDHVYIN
ncbi:MAG: hypothetical protein JXB14_06965 [Candidatus Altiarchaeota archaeon]|nr:hypothetical protein [Candidatus Altiarchaeota archaeon]